MSNQNKNDEHIDIKSNIVTEVESTQLANDDIVYKSHGILFCQTQPYDCTQIQNIDAHFRYNVSKAPKLLFVDYFLDKRNDEKQLQFDDKGSHGDEYCVTVTETSVDEKLKVSDSDDNHWHRTYGVGIPVHFKDYNTFYLFIETQFNLLKQHLINGGDVVIPYASEQHLNNTPEKYYRDSKQLIFHNIIGELSFEQLLSIQRKISLLKSVACEIKKVDVVWYDINIMQQEINTLKTNRIKSDNDIMTLKRQLNETTFALDQFSESSCKIVNRMKQLQEILRSENSELKCTVDDLTNKLQNSTALNAAILEQNVGMIQMKQEIASLEAVCKHKDVIIHNITEDFSSEEHRLHNDLQKKQNQIISISLDKDKQRNLIQQQYDTIYELKLANAKTIEVQNSLHSELKNDLVNLEIRYKNYKVENQEAMAVLETQCKKKEQIITELKIINSKLNQQFKEQIDARETIKDNIITELRKTIEDKHKKCNNLQNINDDNEERYREGLDVLKVQIQNLRKECNQKNEDLKNNQQQIYEMQQEVSNCKSECAEKNEIIMNISLDKKNIIKEHFDKINGLKNELDNLQNRFGIMEKDNHTLQNKCNHLQDELNTNIKLHYQFKDQIDELERKCNEKDNTITKLNKSIEHKDTMILQLHSEKRLLRKSVKMELKLENTKSVELDDVKSVDEFDYSKSCAVMQIAAKVIQNDLKLSIDFMDAKNDKCFCNECHKKRTDKEVYYRGDPSKKYGLPIGWVRFGLNVCNGRFKMNDIWDKWHVAFHGTNRTIVPEIFKSGLILLKPGDTTADGKVLGIREGHIKGSGKRKNLYTNKDEIFDPKQIFVSPSIKYASHDLYARPFYFKLQNAKYKVKYSFQLRIRSGCYGIGQETIGATRKNKIIDKNFENNELEWYTKENVGVAVHGLLVHVEKANS
eukprot:296845_1